MLNKFKAVALAALVAVAVAASAPASAQIGPCSDFREAVFLFNADCAR